MTKRSSLFVAMLWWLAVVVPPMVWHLAGGSLPETFGFEAGAVLIIALSCGCSRWLSGLLNSLSKNWAVTVLAVAGLPWSAQLVSDSNRTFPLLQWGMYCIPVPPPNYAEFLTTFASGEKRPFPFEEFSAYAAVRSFSLYFDRKAVLAFTKPGEFPEEELNEELRTLTALYNRKHPGDPIAEIEIRVVRLEMQTDRSAVIPTPHHLHTLVP